MNYSRIDIRAQVQRPLISGASRSNIKNSPSKSNTLHTAHNREMQHAPAPCVICAQVCASLYQLSRTRYAPSMSSVHQRRYPVDVRLGGEVTRDGGRMRVLVSHAWTSAVKRCRRSRMQPLGWILRNLDGCFFACHTSAHVFDIKP